MKQTYYERIRPNGYQKKVWYNLCAEIELEIEEIKKEIKIGLSNESEYSLKYKCLRVGLPLEKSVKQDYDYLEMRASGRVFSGRSPLDSSALERWYTLGGKRIGSKSTWNYDHTLHITSAKKINNQWCNSFTEKPLKTTGGAK